MICKLLAESQSRYSAEGRCLLVSAGIISALPGSMGQVPSGVVQHGSFVVEPIIMK